jgi:hypothetical protein
MPPPAPSTSRAALSPSASHLTDQRDRIVQARKKMFTLGDSSDMDLESQEDRYSRPPVIDLTLSTEDFEVLPRPQLTRRFAETPTTSDENVPMRRYRTVSSIQRRRWTLAMTDDGVTDEKLVEEFQKIRHEAEEEDIDSEHDEEEFLEMRRNSLPGAHPPMSESGHSTSHIHVPHLPPTALSLPALETMGEESTWPSALRALLTTRDLLRTERNYLRSLQALLRSCPCELPPDYQELLADIPANSRYTQPVGEHSRQLPWPTKPPAATMAVYLMALIRTSSVMLKKMQDNPSVFGVTMAFVLCEEVLEEAYVAWCGSVASWYHSSALESDSQSPSKARRLSRAKFSSPDIAHGAPLIPPSSSTSPKSIEKYALSPIMKELPALPIQTTPSPPDPSTSKAPLKRTTSTGWRRSLPALPALIVGTSGDGGDHGHSAANPHSPTIFTSRKKTKKYRAKLMSVRELGILPVQRVTRYGLLFKGLSP